MSDAQPDIPPDDLEDHLMDNESDESIERELAALAASPEFMAIIEQGRREIAEGKFFTLEEIKRELGL
jgi:hypothetical protein